MTGTETISCPICQGTLKKYDRRIRKAIGMDGKQNKYSLRRLRCLKCKRMHLELPNFLVPHKRYEIRVIEAVIKKKEVLVPYEERTIKKIRKWYILIKKHLEGIWNYCVKCGFASPLVKPEICDLVRASVNSGFWSYHLNGH